MNGNKLNDNQRKALTVVDDIPRTAKELGVAAATLTSLVKRGLIQADNHQPKRYFRPIVIGEHIDKGGVAIKDANGVTFEYNMYKGDKPMRKVVIKKYSDNVEASYYLMRDRVEDPVIYAISRDVRGIEKINREDIEYVK